MYIIDRNKDYYDHYSNIYGVDKKVVFDRRGSVRITDSDIVSLAMSKYTRIFSRYLEREFYVVLEVGETQYLLQLNDVKLKLRSDTNIEVNDYQLQIVRVFDDHKHYYESAISLCGVDINWLYRHVDVSRWQSSLYSDLIRHTYKHINLPIIGQTKLTKLIDGDTVWKLLQTYLSNLNTVTRNDTQTDIQKLESHGFDKKFSFRGK